MIFKINDREFPRPKDFTMQREPYIAAKLTTLSGREIGDIRGYRYASQTLVWPVLTDDELNYLLEATNTDFTITFDDLSGEKIVSAFKTHQVANKSFQLRNGKPSFLDIEMGVDFPNVYK